MNLLFTVLTPGRRGNSNIVTLTSIWVPDDTYPKVKLCCPPPPARSTYSVDRVGVSGLNGSVSKKITPITTPEPQKVVFVNSGVSLNPFSSLNPFFRSHINSFLALVNFYWRYDRFQNISKSVGCEPTESESFISFSFSLFLPQSR